MATKIISKQTEWSPVTIEMEFTTREQLALFVEIMGASYTIAEAIESDDFIKACNTTKKMDIFEIEQVIDQLMDVDTWNHLKGIVNS